MVQTWKKFCMWVDPGSMDMKKVLHVGWPWWCGHEGSFVCGLTLVVWTWGKFCMWVDPGGVDMREVLYVDWPWWYIHERRFACGLTLMVQCFVCTGLNSWMVTCEQNESAWKQRIALCKGDHRQQQPMQLTGHLKKTVINCFTNTSALLSVTVLCVVSCCVVSGQSLCVDSCVVCCQSVCCVWSVIVLCLVSHCVVSCQPLCCVWSAIVLCLVSYRGVSCQSLWCVLSVTVLCLVSHCVVSGQSIGCVWSVIVLCLVCSCHWGPFEPAEQTEEWRWGVAGCCIQGECSVESCSCSFCLYHSNYVPVVTQRPATTFWSVQQ